MKSVGLASMAVAGIALASHANAYAADVSRGSALFQTHCAICHGANGEPKVAGTPDLRRGLVLTRSDSQLVAAIRAGRGVMPAYLGVMNERDMLDVVAFMRTLR